MRPFRLSGHCAARRFPFRFRPSGLSVTSFGASVERGATSSQGDTVAIDLKPGDRFRSAVCSTEIVVVKAPAGAVDLRCGGVAVLRPDEDAPSGVTLDATHAAGSLIGKRYSDGAELEILCSKGGDGSLSIGDTDLEIKGAKPLPSSD